MSYSIISVIIGVIECEAQTTCFYTQKSQRKRKSASVLLNAYIAS